VLSCSSTGAASASGFEPRPRSPHRAVVLVSLVPLSLLPTLHAEASTLPRQSLTVGAK